MRDLPLEELPGNRSMPPKAPPADVIRMMTPAADTDFSTVRDSAAKGSWRCRARIQRDTAAESVRAKEGSPRRATAFAAGPAASTARATVREASVDHLGARC
jgi:hypothetical protein